MVHLRDLGLDARLLARFEALGYGELWPSQEKAAPLVVAGKNLVLAVPTASGKSLVAYLALLTKALRGGKGLYLVPLRALASEKYEDLKALAEGLGLRVAISVGDLDDAEPQLGQFDVIVTTNEKADALLRHRAHWLQKISCIVADEVHLLNEPDRGPTMEVLLARFKQLNADVQMIALSATVANSQQVADWLRAEHVYSTWRPVTLREGVHYGRSIKFDDNGIVEVASDLEDPSLALAEDAVRAGGQCLVFVNTRKSTEALAEKLATSAVKPHLTADAKAALKEAAATLKGVEDATSVEARLAKCIAGGAAFHHAGLRNRERALVEDLFKRGLLKALSATPTLAAGINLPARRVVVRDLWRYEADEGGNAPISVMEYKQMAGRAGRPKYDKVGEAVTIAKTHEQRGLIAQSYIFAEPERVESKLGTEGALYSHILASVASGFVKDEASLEAFIKATFFAHQYDLWKIQAQVTTAVDYLLEHDFLVQEGATFRATRYGKRVSELYIQPQSAEKLRTALGRGAEPGREVTELGLLHAVCATPDVRPLFIRRADAWLEGEALEREKELLLPPPAGFEYEFFLQELKTACLLRDWVEEVPEEELVKKYGVYPGDVHNKTDSAEWLLGAAEEAARVIVQEATPHLAEARRALDRGAMSGDREAAAAEAARAVAAAARWLGPPEEAPPAAFETKERSGEFVTYTLKAGPKKDGRPDARRGGGARKGDPFEDARREVERLAERAQRHGVVAKQARQLGVRVAVGAKAEILPLIESLRGVGRYRARQLWKAGYRSTDALRAAAVADLARVTGIGLTIATSIKRQLGEAGPDARAKPSPPEAAEPPKGGQMNLGDFG